MTKLVRELMRPGVVTCKPQATLGQVAKILTENHVHALFVVGADGKIKGIITDFDLLAGEWLSGDPESLAAMRRMTAGDLMSAPVNSIEASAPAKEAAQRMQERVVRRLLVTENGKPVGVISVSDIVASIAEKAIIKTGDRRRCDVGCFPDLPRPDTPGISRPGDDFIRLAFGAGGGCEWETAGRGQRSGPAPIL